MANYQLSKHFAHFFGRLNPSPSFEQVASREYSSIKGLIEARNGLAASLSPCCFLQGSYRQQTAIYTINDVDIVVLCELWHPGSSGSAVRSYGRDEIFDTIAAPLLNDSRYRSKVRYERHSMCIKVDLGIKLEILPVVYKAGNSDPQAEPFRLYRPENRQWEDGYARYHQAYLSQKNSAAQTGGNFIPAIKVFKHMRTLHSMDLVSFHLECFLHSLPDRLFHGSPADYLEAIFNHIAATSADDWYGKVCRTPCGERDIFTPSEWPRDTWNGFHEAMKLSARAATMANQASDPAKAIEIWQIILGDGYFPKTVS